MEQLRHKDQEHVILIALDARMRLICDKTLYIGTVSSCRISARDIFRQALMTGAAQIALVHNHPSGNPLPSDADIEMTRRILELGHIMEIPVYDHIIIGDRQYSSLNEVLNRN
jgi:DNA repair protein RadC